MHQKHIFVHTVVSVMHVCEVHTKLHWCCMSACATLCLCLYIFVLALGRESGWLLPASWQLCTEAWRHHHHSAGSSPRYIPRRAVLYCPGNDERKLRKLASLDVDCAVLDCEDGVALSKKVHKYTCDEWNAASFEWIRQGQTELTQLCDGEWFQFHLPSSDRCSVLITERKTT